MRRAGVVLSGIVVALVAVGCASVGHTWEDEFTARLEGATGQIEEAMPVARRREFDEEGFAVLVHAGEKLGFEAELVKKLDPPAGCEEVEEKGWRAVYNAGDSSYNLFKDLTPFLERRVAADMEEQVRGLEALAQEAKTCATDKARAHAVRTPLFRLG